MNNQNNFTDIMFSLFDGCADNFENMTRCQWKLLVVGKNERSRAMLVEKVRRAFSSRCMSSKS